MSVANLKQQKPEKIAIQSGLNLTGQEARPDPYRTHQAEVVQKRTSPMSGRFRVRVWVESIERQRPISDIASITYHVWNDFNPAVISTSDQASNFDLWLSVYGEFPVLALVRTKSGETYELQRFVDLPGRPPD